MIGQRNVIHGHKRVSYSRCNDSASQMMLKHTLFIALALAAQVLNTNKPLFVNTPQVLVSSTHGGAQHHLLKNNIAPAYLTPAQITMLTRMPGIPPVPSNLVPYSTEWFNWYGQFAYMLPGNAPPTVDNGMVSAQPWYPPPAEECPGCGPPMY